MTDPVSSMASSLAHLMLIQERNKAGLKKSEIQRLLIRGHAEGRTSNTRLFKEVLDKANRILDDTLGYRVVEVPGKAAFILVNKLDFKGVEQFFEVDCEKEQIRGLLCVILSMILMKGGEIQEDQLWEFLEKLNVAGDDRNHPIFGDVEKLVKTTLTKSHYLDLVRERHRPASFRWGIRSEYEFNKMEMLDFVASIYGEGRTARDFSEIFLELEKEQVEAAQSSESSNENSNAEE